MQSDTADDQAGEEPAQTEIEPPPGFGKPLLGGALQPTPGPWLLGFLETYKVWKLLRQRLARMCQLVLPAEEAATIRYAIYGQRHGVGPLSLMFFIPPGPRMIVVTQNYVWVIRVGLGWTNAGLLGLPFLTPPKEVLGQLPRNTRIGPLDKLDRTIINGERIRMAPRYVRDVEAADSEIAQPRPTA
jgi:hypothetical protein